MSTPTKEFLKRKESGSLNWTRTSDPLINSQLLYQLSYQGTVQCVYPLLFRMPSENLIKPTAF